ncbi:tetratricopeptide repeat protein [Clostridium botulinum]|nr:tetratricopeptide repeat protein [Clostridium botulinum]
MNLRENARKLKNNKNYKDAITIYKELINNDKLDKWLGWEYADCLKKNNQIDEAIVVAKRIYKENNDFKYIKDLLSWLVYEKYFKNLDLSKDNKKDIEQLCRIGSFILNITIQEKTVPYEITVCKIVKLLENISFENEIKKYQTILKWIEKLDINKLIKTPIAIKTNNLKNNEKASVFEEIYYLKIKCLFKIKNYNIAEDLSKKFLKENIKFHNDRDKWTKRLIADCEWNLNNKKESIKLLYELEKIFNHWVIKYEIADKEYKLGNLNSSLYYVSKGILGNEPIEKKKSLLKLQYKVLSSIGKNEESNYIQAYYLSLGTEENNIDIKKKILDICKSSIEVFPERKYGVISKILSNNKAGFIQSGKESFYFKKKNVLSKNIEENNHVNFKLINSFDVKKNKETLEAVDIIVK